MDNFRALKVVFSCIIFSLIFCFHFIEGEGKEFTFMERNVTMTIKTKYGNEYDCVYLYKQPSLKHHLLKDHKIQMRPSFIVQNIDEAIGMNQNERPTQIGCPSGTVPIRRATKEELIREKAMFREQSRFSTSTIGKNGDPSTGLIFAGIGTKFRPGIAYHGAGGQVGVWNPRVNLGQFSASVMSIEGGSPDQFSVIRVGWMVNPSMFKDNHAHLYTLWGQNKNGVMHGCYNTYCPGFVHVDSTVALDMILEPVSTGGQERYLKLEVSQDKSTGDWWLSYGYGQNYKSVGYWPSILLTNLHNGAEALRWGGMVYSSTDDHQVPVMGNGDSGSYHSCHFRHVALKYEAGLPLNGTIDAPIEVIKTKCYDAGGNYYRDEFWGYSFYFGGNGGSVDQCK